MLLASIHQVVTDSEVSRSEEENLAAGAGI